MQENEIKQKPIQIINILKESFVFYKANFRFFVLISLLGSSISLIEQFLSTIKISLGWFSLVTTIVGVLISIWAQIALILAVSKRFQNQEIDIKESFLAAKSKIWRFIGVSFFCGLIFITGCLLFVIPGFYWGTMFALVGLVVILEDTAFFDSFRRSKNLIKGYFWPIFTLYLVPFLIFIPAYFIYSLNIAIVVKALIVTFIVILYYPWLAVINMNIYSKLKKIKGENENIEVGKAKKGMGCLGCLGSIGLFIAIIILSTIWFSNLGGFLKTGKGQRVYEWVSEKVSPKIELQDDVILERPKDYLVIKSEREITTYILYGFIDNKFSGISIFSVPFEDLNITDRAVVQLGSEEIWDKYSSYLISQNPFTDMKLSNMQRNMIKVVNIAGRPWGECRLKEKEREYAKSQKVWVYNYTLTDNSVLFVSYGYILDAGREESVLHKKEAERIISRFYFQ